MEDSEYKWVNSNDDDIIDFKYNLDDIEVCTAK